MQLLHSLFHLLLHLLPGCYSSWLATALATHCSGYWMLSIVLVCGKLCCSVDAQWKGSTNGTLHSPPKLATALHVLVILYLLLEKVQLLTLQLRHVLDILARTGIWYIDSLQKRPQVRGYIVAQHSPPFARPPSAGS